MHVSQLQAISLASSTIHRESNRELVLPASQADDLAQNVIHSTLEFLTKEFLPGSRGSIPGNCTPNRASMYTTLARIVTTLQLLDELFTIVPIDSGKEPAPQEKPTILVPEFSEPIELLKAIKQTKAGDKNRDLQSTTTPSRSEVSERPPEHSQTSPSAGYTKGPFESPSAPAQVNTTGSSHKGNSLLSDLVFLSDPRLSTPEDVSIGTISEIVTYDRLNAAVASLTDDILDHVTRMPLLRGLTEEIGTLLDALIEDHGNDLVLSSDPIDHRTETSNDSDQELHRTILEQRSALLNRLRDLRNTLLSTLDRTSYQRGLTVELNRMVQSDEILETTSFAQVARLFRLEASTLDDHRHMPLLLLQAVPMLDPATVSRLISLLVNPDRLRTYERAGFRSRTQRAKRNAAYVVDERAIEHDSENEPTEDTNDPASKDTERRKNSHQ